MSYTNKHKEKLYDECIKKWGAQSQATLAMEEAAEFIQAMSKHLRFNSFDSHEALAEELCDLRLMLNQVEVAYGMRKKCQRFEDWKLKRLEGRLED